MPKPKKAKRNLNLQAAYLHVLGDLLNSIGVTVAAAVIMFMPQAWWCDPLCTFVFSAITFVTTVQTFRACIITFLEGTPEHIDTDEIREKLEKIQFVESAHDLHCWEISQDKVAFTVHIQLKNYGNCIADQFCQQQFVLEKADRLMRDEFSINHLVIQIESPGGYQCGNDLHA